MLTDHRDALDRQLPVDDRRSRRIDDYRLREQGEYMDGPEESIDLVGLVRTLWLHKWLIALVFIVGMTAALVLTLRQVPLYRSVATIEVQREERQIIEGAAVDPLVVADAEYMATQIALMQSRMIAERVAEELNLVSDERFVDQVDEETQEPIARAARVNAAIERILENLTVAPQARSRILKVTFIDEDRVRAARVANAIVTAFIQTNLERRFNSTLYARTFLQERLAATKVQLEDSERLLRRYAEEKGLLELEGGSGSGSFLEASSLVQLNTALAEAERDRIGLAGLVAQVRAGQLPISEIQAEAFRELNAARAVLVAEYEEKRGTLKPEFPSMKALETRIAAMDAEIENERQRFIASTEAEYQSAVAREEALRTRVNDLKSEVQTLHNRTVDYTILKREVDTNRSQYDALLQRLKEVSAVQDMTSNQVALVDEAIPADEAFSPAILRILLLASVLSLGLGVGLAFGLSYIDDTIKTPEDLRDKLGLPPLGVIPKAGGDDLVGDLLNDPRSRLGEAFASLRTSLLFAIPEAKGRGLSLVITSSRPAEGKTSSSLGLALAAAATGQRVLIIDADLRKPSFLSRAQDSDGLSHLLLHHSESLAEHVVQSPQHPNLSLLPSGKVPPNPAELLSSARLPIILEEAERKYDLVIVDSPPIMDFADALLLSAACDATILAVQAGSIRRENAERSLDRLRTGANHILGGVLTKFNARKHGYGYGYGYTYDRYGYRADTEPQQANGRFAPPDKRMIRLFFDERDAR